ncbi:MAG: putative Se/S carrier-like protein [Acutalibacteraceae bacterium]
MEKELIYIGSVNKALKSREILKKNGITSKVERGLMKSPSKGCGYSVLVVDGKRQDAIRILEKNGIIKNDES